MKNSYSPFVRSAYNYDTSQASDEAGLSCPEPTLAQQQFRDDSDPNVVMELFTRTGDASFLQQSNPQYADFLHAPVSFHQAQNQVIAARNAFMDLPARLRARFDNDPAQFVNFVEDDKNYDEAVDLGILKKDAFKRIPASSEELLPSSPIPTGREGKNASVPPKGGKSSTGSHEPGE